MTAQKLYSLRKPITQSNKDLFATNISTKYRWYTLSIPSWITKNFYNTRPQHLPLTYFPVIEVLLLEVVIKCNQSHIVRIYRLYDHFTNTAFGFLPVIHGEFTTVSDKTSCAGAEITAKCFCWFLFSYYFIFHHQFNGSMFFRSLLLKQHLIN